MERGRGGVEFEDLAVGEGAMALRGSDVEIVYTLTLNRGETVQANQPCAFRIGSREVIPGLEYGVEGMRAGGERRIRVGPHLGYRDRRVPGVPPDAVLEFRVKLIKVLPRIDPAPETMHGP
jgi:FKBP-type peptidyl-prolyl cis-trans isomerase